MSSRSGDDAFVARVLDAAPTLADSYREHLSDNGELLPYVYLPDAVRALELQMREGELDQETCSRFAAVIEAGLAEGGSVRNLVLLGLIDEIASCHGMSVTRSEPSLLNFMRNVFGARTADAIAETLAVDPLRKAETHNN